MERRQKETRETRNRQRRSGRPGASRRDTFVEREKLTERKEQRVEGGEDRVLAANLSQKQSEKEERDTAGGKETTGEGGSQETEIQKYI